MKKYTRLITISIAFLMFFGGSLLLAVSKNKNSPSTKDKNVISAQRPVQERIKKSSDDEKNVIRDVDVDEDDAFVRTSQNTLPEETFDFVSNDEDDSLE